MIGLPRIAGVRLIVAMAAALAVVGWSAFAQEVIRGGQRQQDPRVRDGYGGPQAPPPINGTLKGLHPSGGFIIEEGEDTGVVAVDRNTEVIIRGEADESFVAVGSLVQLSGTLEGQRGPISTNYIAVLLAPGKNNPARNRWQPVFNANIPMPGENRPATATIRGQVVSLNPLIVSANNQKVLIRVEEPVQVWLDIAGGDPRTLCKEDDRISVSFGVQQRRDLLVAQSITITRAEPFTATDADQAAKDGKKKDDAPPEKGKKAAKGKAMPKGKMEAQPEKGKKSAKDKAAPKDEAAKPDAKEPK